MTTFKHEVPWVSFSGLYHDELRCPCGGHLHHPRPDGVRSCDGLGFEPGRGATHYWRMRDDLTWEQVEEKV